jgi:hypothetical protein
LKISGLILNLCGRIIIDGGIKPCKKQEISNVMDVMVCETV